MPLAQEFPINCKVFFLGQVHYGCPASVIGHDANTLGIRIAVRLPPLPTPSPLLDAADKDNQHFLNDASENPIFKTKLRQFTQTPYFPAFQVSRQIRLQGLALSKLTSSIMITTNDKGKLNIGLNLKFEAKSLKVLGYSRKGDGGWEFSEKAIALIKEYMDKFPEVPSALDKRGGGGELI